MTTMTTKKTGWFIRQSSWWAGRYYPIFIFEDGEEASVGAHSPNTVEECRRVIRDHFDNGRVAPKRPTRLSPEEAEAILYRTCLSDPF